ncbi:MAG: hypothetical protein ABI831_14205 [Betaproteobacteria bacterium]
MNVQTRPALAALLAAALGTTVNVCHALAYADASMVYDGAANVVSGDRDSIGLRDNQHTRRLPLQLAQAVAPPLNGGQPALGLSGGPGSLGLSGGPGNVALSGGTGVVATPLPGPLPPQSIRPNPLAGRTVFNGRPTAFAGAVSGFPGALPGLPGSTPGLTPSRPGLSPFNPTPRPDPVP